MRVFIVWSANIKKAQTFCAWQMILYEKKSIPIYVESAPNYPLCVETELDRCLLLCMFLWVRVFVVCSKLPIQKNKWTCSRI